MLAKEIIDAVLDVMEKKKIGRVKAVFLEIGTGSLPHDHQHDHDHDEHFEELNMENVEFGVRSIAEKTVLKDTRFEIKKIDGGEWKITKIEI